MKVGEVIPLPQIVTVDATPVRLGKEYFVLNTVTRIEAVVLAGQLGVGNAASWHLQYSFQSIQPTGYYPYPLGSGIRTKESKGDGSLWDCSIVTSLSEVNDEHPKFWFEITGLADTEIVWGGRATIWTLDLAG